MASSRIAVLASIISDHTTKLDECLAQHGLPSPSFAPNVPPRAFVNRDIVEHRQRILDATDELHALMLGPAGILTTPAHNFMISLQAVYRFKLATYVSDGEDGTSFEEIASASGLSVSQTRRLLRHAMAYHIFCEPKKGFVAHTAASKMLSENGLIRQWVGMVSEEMWPSAAKTVEAISRWGSSEEPNQCGFNLAHSTDCGLFDELPKFPAREQRYADAMAWFSGGPGFETSHILENYDWAAIGNGLVVDIGGSYGAVAIAIANKFHSIQCIVQDRPEVVTEGQNRLSDEIPNVTFMPHDFFTDQPVKGADVYFLRWILHDWSDKYAIQILRSLVPALKPGAKVLVNEYVVSEAGTVSAYEDRMYRGFDLAMLEFHNGKERDAEDWAQLFKDADPRFQILGVKKPPMSRLGLIEATWTGS